MKKFFLTASAGVLLLSAGCADLGYGVEVDSGVSPYWYGNGYLGDYYWNTPVWDYGPIYNPFPPAPIPPVAGNGPGSIMPPMPSKPGPRPTPRPPQNNSGGNVLGPNGIGWNPGIPTHVGNVQRPGNGGMANPPSVPQGKPIQPR